MDAPSIDFDFNNFESRWETIPEDDKAELIEKMSLLDPELAILPVLAGIRSYHFATRNNARKGLNKIQFNIKNLLADRSDEEKCLKGLKASASVAARIYSRLVPDMSLNELGFFFSKLLELEGLGARFAFKAVYKELISTQVMEKIMSSVPEEGRMAFVDQYLQANPSVRLKFGYSFKRILRSIKNREVVVAYYADLFDRQRDTDPFLNNIPGDMRNPDDIISGEINSSSAETRIIGLKALAMLIPRISSDLLLDILISEKKEKVRMAIYNIIENASMGTYSKLYYPLLELFYKNEKKEALQTFKALVVSGKVPLYKLITLVRENKPEMIQAIYSEISTLTKMSFFFIQDMALNKEKYLNLNFEINLAAVFGMIKKRPERVVTILKNYDDESNDTVRLDVTKFIENTKQLLQKEKKSIEIEFNPMIEKVTKESQKSKGLIRNFFADSSDKKIEILKAGKKSGTMDFEGETIRNADLSASDFICAPLFFSGSILDNCDFNNATFTNTYFKKSIFYNVDMRKARFENVIFDNAVFINVNAQGAQFDNSSFQNVSIFNSNFNQAVIRDASFLNSNISKTAFNQADLSGSSFTFSKISAVSFVNSNIEHTDFSNVKARFCRFPTSSKSTVNTENIDYNARKFQLSFRDMPRVDKKIVSRINLMIFTEFIHYGEKKFLKQNQLSLLTAFDIFKTKQADLFQIIPFLLHENFSFPGMDSLDMNTPKGVCDYMPSLETRQILVKYIGNKKIPVRQCPDHVIQGLFTIGSVGSLAQTEDSDIDYWVCIDEEKLSPLEIELFNTKLLLMEALAWKYFETKVTFFPVDIHKAKHNDFGDSTIESSGSAQARLLKEEFYRTMIWVAGKIPLWSVLPTAISIHYYNSILGHITSTQNLIRYIDLGDIHAIPTSEYFGASIWQMFKWLKSPFKSVIKMALLEKYIYEYGKESLLCNKYKDEWMNSGAHLKLAQNDAYYILLKNLIAYYENSKDLQSAMILLTCFFLKLGISKESEIENTVFGLRKILLEKCLDKWGWQKEKVFEIGSFKSWQYHNIVKLSNTIEKYMVKKYKIVNKSFDRLQHDRSGISPEDRTVLGRKIYIEFSKQPGKIPKTLLVSRSDRHFFGLHLQYLKKDIKESKGDAWELFNKNLKADRGRPESLIQAKTIEEIGAWLIQNGLYNENTPVNMIPNPTYATFDDIKKLYKAMYDFFTPVIKNGVNFDQLLEKNRVACLFVSINFYAPRQENRVKEYSAVYVNSWGEMFCRSIAHTTGFSSMDDAKKDILTRIGIEKFPTNTAFYFSKNVAR